jgi:hypothetical protein
VTIRVLGGWSPRLQEELDSLGDRADTLCCMPMVSIVGECGALPGERRSYPLSRRMYGLLSGIDEAIQDARCLRRTRARNGNRWAVGSPASPGGYPVASKDGQVTRIVEDASVSHRVSLGFPTTLNLSLAFPPDITFRDDHPVSIATRTAAQEMIVLAAAGNYGRRPGQDTLSALARLPWVLAVGATTDETGSSLHDCSPATTVEGKPVAVVACGRDPFVSNFSPDGTQLLVSGNALPQDQFSFGTSFAAPRVTRQLRILRGFLASVEHARNEIMLDPAARGGIPLTAAFTIDEGKPFPRDPPRAPALPLNTLNRESVELMQHWSAHLGAGKGENRNVLDDVRELLLYTAREVPGHEEHEVGSGFVGDATTRDFLENVSALSLMNVRYGGEASANLPASTRRSLGNAPLLDCDLVPSLIDLWGGQLGLDWYCDIGTGQITDRGFCRTAADSGAEDVVTRWTASPSWGPS